MEKVRSHRACGHTRTCHQETMGGFQQGCDPEELAHSPFQIFVPQQQSILRYELVSFLIFRIGSEFGLSTATYSWIQPCFHHFPNNNKSRWCIDNEQLVHSFGIKLLVSVRDSSQVLECWHMELCQLSIVNRHIKTLDLKQTSFSYQLTVPTHACTVKYNSFPINDLSCFL